MRKVLVGITAATVLVTVLAATTLAACDGGADEPAASRSSTERENPAASSTTSTEPSTTAVAVDDVAASESPSPAPAPVPAVEEAAAAPAPTAAPAPDVHFVCPEGGMAEVIALQEAVDQGHQPWRLSAEDVAAACTLGGGSTVEPVGPNSYRVTNPGTGESVHVELAQPLGPDGIWVVTSAHPV